MVSQVVPNVVAPGKYTRNARMRDSGSVGHVSENDEGILRPDYQ